MLLSLLLVTSVLCTKPFLDTVSMNIFSSGESTYNLTDAQVLRVKLLKLAENIDSLRWVTVQVKCHAITDNRIICTVSTTMYEHITCLVTTYCLTLLIQFHAIGQSGASLCSPNPQIVTVCFHEISFSIFSHFSSIFHVIALHCNVIHFTTN
jgi:hypothetical protein